jgi:GH15 family glucan-1,4-alpha-glucosidase
MANFVDEATGLPHASYDLWEQKFLTSTYTVCVVIAALETAIKLAAVVQRTEDVPDWQRAVDRMREGLKALYHPDGYFRKGFLLQEDGSLAYDDVLDISNLYGPYMFANLPLDDPRMQSTFEHVKKDLYNTSPIGGVIRDTNDGYFRSKQQYKGNPWIVCTLWLAQYFEALGEHEQAAGLLQWAIDRKLPSGILSEQFDPETGYAIGVAPLVWSHAEFANTSLDIAKLK